MSIKIRLSRGGTKKRPFYHIVAADSRAPRDGRFIEKLGFYNPLLPKDAPDALRVKEELVKKWLAVGAEPTERVQKLLALLGLCEKVVIVEQPKKSAPKAKAMERIKAAEEKAAAEAAAKAEAEAAAKAEAEAAAAAEEAPATEETATETAEG